MWKNFMCRFRAAAVDVAKRSQRVWKTENKICAQQRNCNFGEHSEKQKQKNQRRGQVRVQPHTNTHRPKKKKHEYNVKKKGRIFVRVGSLQLRLLLFASKTTRLCVSCNRPVDVEQSHLLFCEQKPRILCLPKCRFHCKKTFRRVVCVCLTMCALLCGSFTSIFVVSTFSVPRNTKHRTLYTQS